MPECRCGCKGPLIPVGRKREWVCVACAQKRVRIIQPQEEAR